MLSTFWLIGKDPSKTTVVSYALVGTHMS